MFDVVKQAEIKPHELARLIGVSRVTASMWLNGHTNPHKLLEAKVQKVLDAVRRALDEDQLPAPRGLTGEDRRNYIHAALVAQLKANQAQ